MRFNWWEKGYFHEEERKEPYSSRWLWIRAILIAAIILGLELLILYYYNLYNV